MTLAGKLAKLFSKMVLINRKYTEPSEVLRALVDDFGNQITLGDQKDIGEFNLNFLERIEEGLGERQQAKKAVDQEDMDFMERLQELEEGGEERMRMSSIRIVDRVKTEQPESIELSPMQQQQSSIFNLFFGKTVETVRVDNGTKQR